MKFSVLTPALLAALAASANAATYSLTNAEACQLSAGQFVCPELSSETTCNADSSCEWMGSYCNVKSTLETKLTADMTPAIAAMTPLYQTCGPKSQAECTGDCAWGIQEGDDGYEAACMPTVAKVTSTLTADGAPDAFVKTMATTGVFEDINCWPKTTEETCGSGCSWDADAASDERNCGVSAAKVIGEVSPVCGSNGSWETAAEGANTTLADAQSEAAETSDSSGAADSASRFALLAASAVAAASLLA